MKNRLDIILETVNFILESRAKDRSDLRERGKRKAPREIYNALRNVVKFSTPAIRVGLGQSRIENPREDFLGAAEDLTAACQGLEMCHRGSAGRAHMAEKLRRWRKEWGGRIKAQRTVDVMSGHGYEVPRDYSTGIRTGIRIKTSKTPRLPDLRSK